MYAAELNFITYRHLKFITIVLFGFIHTYVNFKHLITYRVIISYLGYYCTIVSILLCIVYTVYELYRFYRHVG